MGPGVTDLGLGKLQSVASFLGVAKGRLEWVFHIKDCGMGSAVCSHAVVASSTKQTLTYWTSFICADSLSVFFAAATWRR
jgi:hypothetical protein